MKKNRKHISTYSKVSLTTLAVAVGTFAIYHSATAQQDDTERAPRQGLGRESGPVQPPLEFDEQAKTILAKSAARYKTLTNWHVEQEIVNAGRFTKKVTIDFRAPQNLVVTTNEAKGIKTVAYYDGDTVSTLRDFDSLLEYQVSGSRNSEPAPPGANARLNFGSALGPYLAGFFAGEDNVFGRQPVQTVKYSGTSTMKGVPVDNITVTSFKRNQPVTITYSIGQKDSLLHKVVETGPGPYGALADYVETYSNQKVDVSQTDAFFKFTPPSGAKRVDRFTSSRGLQVNIGDTPFAIKTKDINGQALSLEQYRGKVVLLDFWATWCAPCRAELPNVKAAYAKYKDQGFDVLGISFDISTAPIQPFLTKEAIGWRQVYDGYWNGPIAKSYNVRFIPSTVLIGRDGKVVAIGSGARGEALEPAIQAALAASSSPASPIQTLAKSP